MPVEFEENISFEKLYADKRHRELIAAIKQLKLNDGVENSIDKNTEALNVFLNKVQELSNPNVTVNSDNKIVVGEIKNLITEAKEIKLNQKTEIDNQKKIIQLLEKRPTKLKVIRGYDNRIDFVDVSYDQINKK